MADVWFTSDTHFGHKNIINLCKRPFSSVEEMDEKLIENWNKTVKQGDLVYHLGDFARNNADSYLRRLNGSITAMFGNHDPSKNREIIKNFNYGINQGYDYLERSFNGTKVVMCHYAFRTWRDRKYGAINLFGHSHGNLACNSQQVDVGVDYPEWKFTPVNLDTIKKHLKTLPPPPIEDYHFSVIDIENAFKYMEYKVGYSQAKAALWRICPGAELYELDRIPRADIPRVVEYIKAATIAEKITFQVVLNDKV